MPNAKARAAFPFYELVFFTAAIMAMNALAIDIMLPALGIIGTELHVAHENDRQLIVTAFIIANGVAQIFLGPIVDRFGRRTVLLSAILLYSLASLLCTLANTFTLLVIARILQGTTAAATRVAIIAAVRDQFAGRRMAELMSIAVTIYMAAPMIAPAIGQVAMAGGEWRMIFLVLLMYGVILGFWGFLRMPETLHQQDRQRMKLGPVLNAYKTFLSNRVCLGYTMVPTLGLGLLLGYVTTSEQVFLELFDVGQYFALVFSITALALAIASIINSRLVVKLGMRRLTHGAILLMIAINILHLLFVWVAGDHLIAYVSFVFLSFFAAGFIVTNSNALALEPMGAIAGSAAAMNGFFTTAIAGVIGAMIGQLYNGTTMPIVVCFFLLSVVNLIITLHTENGALFNVGSDHQSS